MDSTSESKAIFMTWRNKIVLFFQRGPRGNPVTPAHFPSTPAHIPATPACFPLHSGLFSPGENRPEWHCENGPEWVRYTENRPECIMKTGRSGMENGPEWVKIGRSHWAPL